MLPITHSPGVAMKLLAVHPSPLTYSGVFLRLEPLGLELVAEAARRAGHEVRLIDLQAQNHRNLFRELETWRPDVIAFSLNYFANTPEVIDLVKGAKDILPDSFIIIGGHSASYIARELLEHGGGKIDCVLKGEGEVGLPLLLEAIEHDLKAAASVSGAVTLDGEGPSPLFVADLDEISPARDLLKNRKKYFIGILDPCASIEFTRGCPWDCSFCSAWTFYGRSYRTKSTAKIVDELERIKEPGVFIVDDVAFLQGGPGMEIGEAIARRGIRKNYYLETRCDVLLRNIEVFRFWKKIGLEFMFLGIEAIDEEGLSQFRKRTNLDRNFEALEIARSLDISVVINIIADPDWDRDRFRVIREWCMEIPEIVSITVNTPYPGTESWLTEPRKITTLDYRMFDIQHAVMPTRLPLNEFYEELVKTQMVLNMKHLGWETLKGTAKFIGRHLLHGQTNFLKSLIKSRSVFNPKLQIADHARPAKYEMSPPPPRTDGKVDARSLYVHQPLGRKSRALDDSTEQFVNETRMGQEEPQQN